MFTQLEMNNGGGPQLVGTGQGSQCVAGRDNSTVLILDRGFDLMTPTMDHYTYSSMILENFDVQMNDAALMYAFTPEVPLRHATTVAQHASAA